MFVGEASGWRKRSATTRKLSSVSQKASGTSQRCGRCFMCGASVTL